MGLPNVRLLRTRATMKRTPVTPEHDHKRLLDNLKTGVMWLDHRLRLRYLNVAAQNLLEISERQAQQLFIGDIFIGAAEDIGEMQTALANNSSFTKRKVELRMPHGRSILVDYTINTFEDDGHTQALLELNSLEHTQRIGRDESLSTAHATTRELVRGLAHEIKNPLGGIRGAAQLLAQELPDNDLHDYTNIIIEEADRLRNLVDRLVGSRKPLNKTRINIHEVLERVAQLIAAETQGRNIEVVRDYDPSIPSLQADFEQLIQAVLNVVRNAMQSLSSPLVEHRLGKIQLKTRVLRNVTIGAKFHRLVLSVEITDNGPGIDPDIIESIFYPMISGRAEGTGLGLSITHGIISQHQGLIQCSSKAEETCFTILLPIINTELS